VPDEAVAAWGGVINFLKHHPALLQHSHALDPHLLPWLLLLLLLQFRMKALLRGVVRLKHHPALLLHPHVLALPYVAVAAAAVAAAVPEKLLLLGEMCSNP
jgi:hypothetical protein